jgi:hypothetical protein
MFVATSPKCFTVTPSQSWIISDTKKEANLLTVATVGRANGWATNTIQAIRTAVDRAHAGRFVIDRPHCLGETVAELTASPTSGLWGT